MRTRTFKIGHSEQGRGVTLIRHGIRNPVHLRIVTRSYLVLVGRRWALIGAWH